MKSITKIIIGILGIAAIGLVTYFVISKEKNPSVTEKKITSPDKDTVATAKVIQDAMFEKIKEALSIDGEEFTLTKEEGVYTNSTNDKMLIIKEDVWKKMIHKIQEKIKNIAKDCNQQYEMPELSEYKFVGLLSYYADSKNMKKTLSQLILFSIDYSLMEVFRKDIFPFSRCALMATYKKELHKSINILNLFHLNFW